MSIPEYGKPSACDCAHCPLRDAPFVPHKAARRRSLCTWVGESPWTREVLAREPFVGPTGKELDAACRRVGLARADADVMNVIACKPPKGFEDADWRKAVTCCAPYRDEWLRRNSGPVLAMGAWAMWVTCGLDSPLIWYGYPVPGTGILEGRRVMPTFHPTFAYLRAPWWGDDMDGCLDRFRRMVDGTWTGWKKPPLLWRGSDATLAEAINNLRRDVLCIDWENTGKDAQFDTKLCLGLGDCDKAVTVIWPPGPLTYAAIQRAFDEAEIITAHNMQHDYLVSETEGLEPAPEKTRCTLIMHAALHPDMWHRLSVAAFRLEWPKWKAEYHEEGEAKGADIFKQALESPKKMDQLCEYNGLDCVSGARVYMLQAADMEEATPATQQVYKEMMDRFWVALDMRRKGVRVDLPLRDKKAKRFKAYRDQAEARFHALAQGRWVTGSPRAGSRVWHPGDWPDINLGVKAMNNAVRSLFFDHFGQIALDFTDANRAKLDAWTLQRWASGYMASRECAVAAKLILRVRKGEHMHGMVESLVVSPDGRFHPAWNPWGALTDRYSCGKPNLLNLPKRGFQGIRDLLIPEDGCTFVGADQSKVELRIIAELAGDQPLIEAFKHGEDVHTLNAIDLFGQAAEPGQPKARSLRDLAKRLVYGFNYGGSAETVWKPLVTERPGLKLALVVELRRRWFQRHPAIKRYHERVYQNTRITKQLRAGTGPRVWYFWPQKIDPNELYNRPIQATSAKIVNDAMLELQRRGWDIRLMCHDEIVLNVPAGQEEAAMRALRETMETPHVIAGAPKVMPVDPCLGPSWGELSEKTAVWLEAMEEVA